MLQKMLYKSVGARSVNRTRHFENETLYWTKAASVLGLPQTQMIASEVPLPSGRAKKELIELLIENLEGFSPPDDDRELVKSGWAQLCRHFGPIFVEKSPHHLCQWSAIALILEQIEFDEEVDFLLVGLVRNPLDSIYSQWKRWGASPVLLEAQWRRAYGNLRKLEEMQTYPLVLIRYEDICTTTTALNPVLSFCGVIQNMEESEAHTRSFSKWKSDPWFHHEVSIETVELAESFGYSRSEFPQRANVLAKTQGAIGIWAGGILRRSSLSRKFQQKKRSVLHRLRTILPAQRQSK